MGSRRSIVGRRKNHHVNFIVYSWRIYMLLLNVYADCNKISSVIYHRQISKYKFSWEKVTINTAAIYMYVILLLLLLFYAFVVMAC